jgi:large subunit ribosomal protein L24
MKIRKNDNVLILAGKDKGKKGKIRRALPREDKVIVEGINMIKRHSKTQGQARQAGIIELEAPLDVSKVMLICNKCNNPARVGFRFLKDGKKARVCRACGEVID